MTRPAASLMGANAVIHVPLWLWYTAVWVAMPSRKLRPIGSMSAGTSG